MGAICFRRKICWLNCCGGIRTYLSPLWNTSCEECFQSQLLLHPNYRNVFVHVCRVHMWKLILFAPCLIYFISSVIRQKCESQNGCFKKTKRQIFWKRNISYPLINLAVRNVRFSENLACFVFLKHLFWDSLLDFCKAYSSGLHLGNWSMCAIVEDKKEAFVS